MKLSNPALIIVPYIIGVAWTVCHPIVSVVTGELKSRGFYVDEAQLGPSEFGTEEYPLLNGVKKDAFALTPLADNDNDNDNDNDDSNGGAINICNALQRVRSNYRYHQSKTTNKKTLAANKIKMAVGENHPASSLTCHSHTTFDVVKIEPTFVPTQVIESLVLVVPPSTDDWMGGDVHLSTLIMIDRLLDRRWLAKAVLIVSPHYQPPLTHDHANASDHTATMDRTTRDFLEAANGPHGPIDSRGVPPLPSSYTRFLIRQLFVIDVTIDIDARNSATRSYNLLADRVYLLPQGRRGLVPNLDLLSTATPSFQKYIRNTGTSTSTTLLLQMHPFDLTWFNHNYVDRYLPYYSNENNNNYWLRRWAIDLGYMGAFMTSMLLGSYVLYSYTTLLAQTILYLALIHSHHPFTSSYIILYIMHHIIPFFLFFVLSFVSLTSCVQSSYTYRIYTTTRSLQPLSVDIINFYKTQHLTEVHHIPAHSIKESIPSQ